MKHITEFLPAVATRYDGPVYYSTGVPFPFADALRLDFPQLTGVAIILRNEGVFLLLVIKR